MIPCKIFFLSRFCWYLGKLHLRCSTLKIIFCTGRNSSQRFCIWRCSSWHCSWASSDRNNSHRRLVIINLFFSIFETLYFVLYPCHAFFFVCLFVILDMLSTCAIFFVIFPLLEILPRWDMVRFVYYLLSLGIQLLLSWRELTPSIIKQHNMDSHP